MNSSKQALPAYLQESRINNHGRGFYFEAMVVPMEDLHRDDPASVGDYRLLSRIGTGGMGIVYLAENPGGWRSNSCGPNWRTMRGSDLEFAGRLKRASGWVPSAQPGIWTLILDSNSPFTPIKRAK